MFAAIIIILVFAIMIRLSMQYLYSHENSKKRIGIILGMIVAYMAIMQCDLHFIYLWQLDMGNDLKTCYEYMGISVLALNFAVMFTLIVNYFALKKKE